MIALYATLIACAVAGALLVIRYDLYEREPWWMLLLVAAGGAAVMSLLGHVEDATLDLFGGPEAGPVTLAWIAASEEEVARFLIVALVASILPSQLNDPIDGLVYGSIAGLGMALEESRFLLGFVAADSTVLPATEPVRLLGHLVLGGITGFPVGMARLALPGWRVALAACLAASIAIHFLWDWIAFSAAARQEMLGAETMAAIVLMLCGLGVYGALVVRGSGWSRRIFSPDSQRGLWGWPFERSR